MSQAQLVTLPNGPYRITGPLEIVDPDGQPVAAPDPPIHLCRCGRSANKPFCDGTHVTTEWKDGT